MLAATPLTPTAEELALLSLVLEATHMSTCQTIAIYSDASAPTMAAERDLLYVRYISINLAIATQHRGQPTTHTEIQHFLTIPV